mgnify:FL=1|jgi:uncharacterized LabA/DUF88 family protein
MVYMYLDGGFWWEIVGYHRDKGKSLEELLNGVFDKIGETPAYMALFQGRFPARSAIEHGAVDTDRIYEDQLRKCGIEIHFYPIEANGLEARERGVDVAIAAHIMHDVFTYKPNTIVLVSGDQDMVPLVRMVRRLGIKVILAGAEFDRTTQKGRKKHVATSSALISASSSHFMIVSE